MCLGDAEAALDNTREGLDRLDCAVAESRAEGEPWQLAMALNDRALVRHFLREPGREPRDMVEEGATLLRQLGDESWQGMILASLALVALDNGDIEAARRFWTGCAGIARRFDDKLAAGAAIGGLASIVVMETDYARGLRLHSAAARLLREWGKTLLPMEQDVIDASITDARMGLGEAEADLAWAAGDDMTLPEALDYALAESRA